MPVCLWNSLENCDRLGIPISSAISLMFIPEDNIRVCALSIRLNCRYWLGVMPFRLLKIRVKWSGVMHMISESSVTCMFLFRLLLM